MEVVVVDEGREVAAAPCSPSRHPSWCKLPRTLQTRILSVLSQRLNCNETFRALDSVTFTRCNSENCELAKLSVFGIVAMLHCD